MSQLLCHATIPLTRSAVELGAERWASDAPRIAKSMVITASACANVLADAIQTALIGTVRQVICPAL